MRFYQTVMAALAPFVLLGRMWRGEGFGDLAERLGRAPVTNPQMVLWLHGASNGELTSARWLVEAILAASPGLQILVTANTTSGRNMVAEWGMGRVHARLAPLDFALPLRAFFQHWQPLALISLEAEFWPARFAACKTRGVAVFMIGARMSARSFARWQRFSGLTASALSAVRLLSAQDASSQSRIQALGLPVGVTEALFDLKAEAIARLPRPALPPRAERACRLLAASTHDGEDAIVLDAFLNAPNFTELILAPRHPSRAPAIIRLLTERGIAFAQRSGGADPGGAPVFLADTLGEMDLWYARAGVVVIGGTYADKGGHTPWEPARFDAAILHGPSQWNFAAAFTRLDRAKAACETPASGLAASLAGMDAALQDRMAAAARTELAQSGDANTLLGPLFTALRIP